VPQSAAPGDIDTQRGELAPTTDDVQPAGARGLVVAVVAVALGVLAWLVLRLATSEWLAVGDYRTLALRVSDVGTSHTPTVGVYSRFGWNHPGPLVFYLLAPFQQLSGGRDVSLLFGALTINLAAIATSLWIGLRAGRRALVLTGLFLALLCVGMNPAGVADPWNPRFMVLAIFTAALAAWRTLFGDRVAAVALVLWGSFAVQCHLGSAMPVLTLVAIGLVALAWRSVGGPDRPRDRGTLVLAVIAGVVVWIPPLIEQFTSDTGNMSQILDFVGNPPADTTGPATGLRVLFRLLSVPGDWVRGAEPMHAGYSYDTRGWAVPWALVGLVVAAAWAWRRRWRAELAACGVAGAAIAASALATSRVVGAPVPYLLWWAWAVAAFTWMAVALVALRQLATTRFGQRYATDLVLVVTLGALLLMVPRGIDLTKVQVSAGWARTIDAVMPATLEAIEDVDGPVWVPDGLWLDGSAAMELVARAEEAGLDVRRSPNWGYVIGEHRVIDRREAVREVVFVNGESRLDFDGNPDYTFVTAFDANSPEDQAELQAIIDRHSEVDVTGMSPIEARDARDAVFAAWRDGEFAKEHPDPDLEAYLRLIRSGGLLSVYVSNGPPR